MSTVTVYSYYDSNGVRNYIDDPELTKLGAWSSSGTYIAPPPYSAVTAGASLYLCITSNIGQNPMIVTVPPRYWSPLVIVTEGSNPPTESDIALSVAIAGSNLAILAYEIAIQGTNTGSLAYNLAAAALPGTGGTLTGPLTVLGDISVQNVQVSVGTVPSSTAVAGTIYYDFKGPAWQQTTVDTNLTVSGTNMGAAREIKVILQQTGTTFSLGYPSTITWYGTTPPPHITNKNVLLDLVSLNTSISSIIGFPWTAQ